jgi:serine/threonine protein kinase
MHTSVLYYLLLHSANWELKNRDSKKPLEGGLLFGIPHFCELVKILQDFNPTLKSTKCQIDTPSSLVYDRTSLIGRGGFGQVYKGKLHGTVCAVKEIAISPQNTLEKIKHEIGIMGDVRHPNLIALLGAHTTKDYVCIITEYIDGGCLRDYLPKIKYGDYTEKLILSMTLDICIAMAWLHSRKPPVYHRDLHTRNILVSFISCYSSNSSNSHIQFKPQLKLCDFGLSLVRGERGGLLKRNNLYKRIRPPDLVEPNQDYSTKSDVYMFGLVLYELITREKAKDVNQIRQNFYDLRERAGEKTRKLLFLFQDCISDDPTNRPEFEKGIIPRVEELIQREEDTVISGLPLSNIINNGYGN